MFGQPFDAIAVQLGVVDRLSADALVREEVQKFVPSDLVVVLAITLVDQPPQLLLVDIYAPLKLGSQIFLRNASVFCWPILRQVLWNGFEFWEELLKFFQFFGRKIKRMQALFRQVAEGLEFVLDLSEL